MRDFGCRECAALTSGDCGKHGPVTYPLNGLSGGRCLVHVLQGLPCQICASLGPVGRFDEYYLAMAALDIYPVPDDGLPKSTSIIFRIHQLGRSVGAQPVAVSAVDPAVQAPHSPSTRDTTSSSSAQWRTDAGNLREQGERIRVAEILASERRTIEGPRDPLYFVNLIRAEAASIEGTEETTQSAANILSYCHQIQESLAVSRSTPAASEPEVQALIERGQKLCEELFDGEVAGSIPENAWETEAVDVISLLIMCVENPPTLRPEAAPAPSLVAGDVLTRPIYEFVRACEHLLTDEQAKASSDNALIAVLCDAVRLTRELQPAVITEAAPDAPLMWAFVVDLFNIVMGDLEWVRAQGGRHSVCPLCHAVCDRDGGPGHLDDCPRMELARRFDALNPNPPVKVVAVAASRSASETTLRKGTRGLY